MPYTGVIAGEQRKDNFGNQVRIIVEGRGVQPHISRLDLDLFSSRRINKRRPEHTTAAHT